MKHFNKTLNITSLYSVKNIKDFNSKHLIHYHYAKK